MRPGKTKQLQASIPAWLYDKLKEMADEDGRSLSNFVGNLLMQWVKVKCKPAEKG